MLEPQNPKSMQRTLKVVGIVLLLGLALSQLIRPDRTNPRVDEAVEMTAVLPVPGPVQDILDRSCMDCHSYRTRWPWYSAVAPASWLVASDVREGREHLNLSEWGKYSRARAASRLDMIISEVDKGEMPPASYLLLHNNARLSEEQKDILSSWAEHVSDSLTASGK